MRFAPVLRGSLLIACGIIAAQSNAQLRLGQWNVSNWNITSLTAPATLARVNGFRTSIYGTFQGRQFAPDAFMVQEITSAATLAQFVNMLNTAAGSPGDWAAAPFMDGDDTESCFVYRTSKVVLVAGPILVSLGQTATNGIPPRNCYRYDFRPVGFNTQHAVMSAYVTHMKAGSTSADQAKRLTEAQRIRADANTLVNQGGIIIAGDFNTQNSSQAAYQELIGNQVNNVGRFFDPINTPGSWNGNQAFRYVQTQDPYDTSGGAGNVGMDDRLDFILLSSGLVDDDGLSYIGNPNIPYSTTTWNDPNHSYRCWGNDGTSWKFQSGSWKSYGITVTNNEMVGTTIAQAIIDSTGLQTAHLPVFCDLRVPPTAQLLSPTIDFGYVSQGSTATAQIQIQNTGNTALWTTNGIADLRYTFNTSGNFYGPAGLFSDNIAAGAQTHNININTSTSGRKTGTVTISTNDPLNPTLTINCTGVVVAPIGPPVRH